MKFSWLHVVTRWYRCWYGNRRSARRRGYFKGLKVKTVRPSVAKVRVKFKSFKSAIKNVQLDKDQKKALGALRRSLESQKTKPKLRLLKSNGPPDWNKKAIEKIKGNWQRSSIEDIRKRSPARASKRKRRDSNRCCNLLSDTISDWCAAPRMAAWAQLN